MIHLRAHVRRRDNEQVDATSPPAEYIDVDADSYEVGKRLILSRLPAGYIVCSWTVSQPTASTT